MTKIKPTPKIPNPRPHLVAELEDALHALDARVGDLREMQEARDAADVQEHTGGGPEGFLLPRAL